MSYLINNELIWISNPKCASYSIETALINSKLEIQKYNQNKNVNHIHIPLNECMHKFGKKESICVTRDWFSKWMSSLNFIWDYIEFNTELTPICKWEDVNNEDNMKCFLKLIKYNKEFIPNIPIDISNVMVTLISQKFYKSNQKCTYEFDIKEINKFINFIENRFGEKLIIENTNISTKRLNKIIINDELKHFIWESFEKRFEKSNKLI